MQDLIGGRTDYMCATIQTGAAQANQGSVKPIAIMGPNRVPIIPAVPTTGEQGLSGVESSVWNAFFLPKGTPDPIVRKLNKAMSDALDDPVMRKRLEELGLEIAPPERLVWMYGMGKDDPHPVKTTLTLAERGATTEATLRMSTNGGASTTSTCSAGFTFVITPIC